MNEVTRRKEFKMRARAVHKKINMSMQSGLTTVSIDDAQEHLAVMREIVNIDFSDEMLTLQSLGARLQGAIIMEGYDNE